MLGPELPFSPFFDAGGAEEVRRRRMSVRVGDTTLETDFEAVSGVEAALGAGLIGTGESAAAEGTICNWLGGKQDIVCSCVENGSGSGSGEEE